MCAWWLRPLPWRLGERRKGKLYIPTTLLMVCGSPAQVEVTWKISQLGEILYIYNPSGGRPKSVCGFLMGIVSRRGRSDVRGNGVNVLITNVTNGVNFESRKFIE